MYFVCETKCQDYLTAAITQVSVAIKFANNRQFQQLVFDSGPRNDVIDLLELLLHSQELTQTLLVLDIVSLQFEPHFLDSRLPLLNLEDHESVGQIASHCGGGQQNRNPTSNQTSENRREA